MHYSKRLYSKSRPRHDRATDVFDETLLDNQSCLACAGFEIFPAYRLAFLVSVGNSNDNAGGAGVLPPFEPGDEHESPETSKTRPSDSLAASPTARRQRPPAHKGEAGAKGRRSVN